MINSWDDILISAKQICKSFKIEFSIIFILEDLWWQNAWIYFVTLKIDVFVVNILYNLPVICVMVIR